MQGVPFEHLWVTQLVTAYGRARRPDGARMALLEAARAGLRTGTEHQLRAFIVALWRAGHIDEAQARPEGSVSGGAQLLSKGGLDVGPTA